jgi:sporulation protein YlmC with PRC-barrel domain
MMAKPERILAHELLDHEVMDLSAGQILGTVVDFAISRDGRVTQLGILPLEWYLGGKGIAPEHITNINADRVCIASAESLAEFTPDGVESFSAMLGERFLGKPVLQHDGEVLGELADFWLSLLDGRICDLVVTGADDKRSKVPVESIKTIGRDYIVIERASVATEPQADPPAPALGKAEAAGDAMPAAKQQPAAPGSPTQAAEPKSEVKPINTQAEAAAPVLAKTEPALDIPPELEAAPPPAPAAAGEPSRSEEKQALFGAKKTDASLSKFDQKKCDFLRGRPAHREIKNAAGDILAAKGDKLDDDALQRIIDAGLLADVFIEMTVNK